MPGRNGSDGSIIIDTGLDTKGFDKGSKELLNAINSLTKEVNQLGKTLQATFSGYGKTAESSNSEVQQLEATVKSLEAKVQSLNATIAELEARLEAAGGQQVIDPASLSDASAAAGDAAEKIAALQARIEELEGVAADLQAQLGQIDAQAVSPTFSMDQPKQSVTTLEKDIDKLGASLKALEGLAGAAINGDVKSLNKFDAQAEKAQDALDGLKQRLEAFGAAKFETDDYKWVQAEITKADNALQKLLDRQAKMQATGVKENSRAYRALEYDIEQTKARLDDLIATRQIYEDSGNAVISGVDTEQFEQYRTALEDIEGQLMELQNEVDAAFQPPHVERWNEMVTLSGMIRGAFSSAFSAIRNGALMVGQAVTHPLQTVDRALGAVASTALRAAGALLSMVRGAVVSAVTRLASAAKKAAVHLAQMVGNAVVNGMKRLASSTLRAAKAVLTLGMGAKKSKSGLKSGLMTVLKYGIGIQSLYTLINRLHSAAKEGFGNLAQYSGEVNKSISSVKSALSQFKNSIAAAFAPIVNAAAPAVTNLIKLLTAATEKFGQFTAALTGQKTFIRAKEVQEDYAASLKQTAKEAKEASRQLAGFDELEILKDNSSQDEDGESKTSPADMFEEAPVGEGPKNLADMIKAAWADADFTDIGRIIGDKLKAALDLIPWGPIKASASKVGKSIATLLNGALEAPGLFTGLGRTLAEAINTAFSFLDGFAWKFHWGSLGNALMDMIEGACDHLDWTLIKNALQGLASGLADFLNTVFSRQDVFEKAGATLGNALNAVVDSALTFFRKVDFTQVGSTIAAGLNSVIKTINWSNLGALLAEYINAWINTIYGAVTTFDWKAAASALAEGINSCVKTLDWAKAGKTFSESLKGLLSSLVTLIEEVDWYQLGQNIAYMMAEIDWSGIIDLLFEGIGAAIGGLAAFLWGLIEDAWNSVVDWWRETAFKDGQFTIEGLLEGILDAVKNIGTWIKEHVVDPIVNGFKEAFGIHSPSTVMAEMGKYLMEGLFKGILDNIRNAGKWIKTNVLKPIQDAFRKAGATIEVWVQLIKDGWENLKGFVGDKLRAFVSLVKSGWTNLSDFAGSTITAFVTLVKQGWDTLGGFVGSVVAVAVTLVKRGWTAISAFVGNAVTVAVSLIKEGWAYVSDFVGRSVSVAVTLVKQGWERISGFVGNAVAVSISLLKNSWTTIADYIGTAITVAVSLMREGWTTLTSFVGNAVTVAVSIIKQGWTTISDFVGTAVTTVVTLAKNGWSTIANYVGETVTTWITLAKQGWTTMEHFVGTAVTVAVSIIKQGWNTISDFVGTAVTTFISLSRSGWTSLASWVGDKLSVLVSLAKSGWSTISNWIGNIPVLSQAISLAKSGWTSLSSWLGTAVSVTVSLAKKGWDTLTSWVGDKLSVLVSLAKSGWSTISSWIGYIPTLNQAISLIKSGWTTVSNWIGNAVSVGVSLIKSGWSSLSSFIGGAVSVLVSLAKSGWTTVISWIGGASQAVSVAVSLVKKGWNTISDFVGKTVSVGVSLFKSGWDSIKSFFGLANGGIIGANGGAKYFASGGTIMNSGRTSWWNSIQKYAGGTPKAHGTMFVAGEAGPEVVGHVNGRTEVLNKSQIAGAMYSAVIEAMGAAVSTFGTFLSQQLATCANAIIAAILTAGNIILHIENICSDLGRSQPTSASNGKGIFAG